MTVTAGDVTVVIPSLPERAGWLGRAVRSAERQTSRPAGIVVHVDHARSGAYAARNKALEQVTTRWVAFLDDDDVFHPDHVEALVGGANRSGADLVSSYPMSAPPGLPDLLVCCYKGQPVYGPVNVPWGPEQIDHLDARRGEICPHCGGRRGSFIMNTNLVRMDCVAKVGGFPAPFALGDGFAGCAGEDYLFLLALLDVGARFHHVTGRRTWTYRYKTPSNTGLPVKSQAA